MAEQSKRVSSTNEEPDHTTEERAIMYAGTTEDLPKVSDGDAGTFHGDYKPAVKPEKPEKRTDLPRGYKAGNYTGDYKPAE